MATIKDVQLTITEKQGLAAATVRYTIAGSSQDVESLQIYLEAIELIGVDTLPGEDGHDEPLPVGKFQSGLVFRDLEPISRTETFLMPSSALDEDPHPILALRDEIKAIVTLTTAPRQVRRDSNIVLRGGISGVGQRGLVAKQA